MGGRGATANSLYTHERISASIRQGALNWAKSQVGSKEYSKAAALGDWKKDSWKCNAFLIRAFNYNNLGKVIGQCQNPSTFGITKRAYSAAEFYNGSVPGFQRVKTPALGDICTNGKHVGIVSGKGKTISASKEGVVENDWGFRKGEHYRYFRYELPQRTTQKGK